MSRYCEAYDIYRRLPTREVKIGNLLMGNGHPIRVQTMTTTDTLDTKSTVEQAVLCIEAGSELVRITAPSKTEAENLLHIKNHLNQLGYFVPLVADIHFTPNAAEIAATIVEKVRVNPGNYVDKKKFESLEYTDEAYNQEIERIRSRFTPLVEICKQYGTAMRIGTNHGSLSDRIMSRFGDTATGMVESAMEFLRIARSLDFHNIVLSMKSSNPLVMVQAYRLLVAQMKEEFSECYPLHLGVTEAGDGEDGRIKSAVGIGSLLEDGIGDTIRVSLTEDPEKEIPVCNNLVEKYKDYEDPKVAGDVFQLAYDPFQYSRRVTRDLLNLGSRHVPIVVADFMNIKSISAADLKDIGYHYNDTIDKWIIQDIAADYMFVSAPITDFSLPSTLQMICPFKAWLSASGSNIFPLFDGDEFLSAERKSEVINFISLEADSINEEVLNKITNDSTVVICLYSNAKNGMQRMRRAFNMFLQQKIMAPVILAIEGHQASRDQQLLHFATQAGGLFIDGFGDGIWLMNDPAKSVTSDTSGRTYLTSNTNLQFLLNTSFSILQAVRTRISKTEYISCPSCGRTLFDLQETTTTIRNVTNHLKGLKIAIMGCIVNGPGEMADADFGYVGSGPGKITLYKGKEVIKRNIDSRIAVAELINLLKENNVWVEPELAAI